MEVPLPAGGFLQLSDLRYSLVAENVFLLGCWAGRKSGGVHAPGAAQPLRFRNQEDLMPCFLCPSAILRS